MVLTWGNYEPGLPTGDGWQLPGEAQRGTRYLVQLRNALGVAVSEVADVYCGYHPDWGHSTREIVIARLTPIRAALGEVGVRLFEHATSRGT